MSTYKFAAICKNGHYAYHSLDTPNVNERFCEECGAELIVTCPSCGVGIRGKYHTPGFVDFTPFLIPHYCYSCGHAFPWTQQAIQSAIQLIEEGNLPVVEQDRLKESLPDIVVETPKTSVAILRFKKAFASVGRITADGLRQFIIDFGCELVKNELLK